MKMNDLFRSNPEFPIKKMLQPAYNFAFKNEELVDFPERVVIKAVLDPSVFWDLSNSNKLHTVYSVPEDILYSPEVRHEVFQVTIYLTDVNATRYGISFFLNVHDSTNKILSVSIDKFSANKKTYKKYSENWFMHAASVVAEVICNLNDAAGTSDSISNGLARGDEKCTCAFSYIAFDTSDTARVTLPSSVKENCSYVVDDGNDSTLEFFYLDIDFTIKRGDASEVDAMVGTPQSLQPVDSVVY